MTLQEAAGIVYAPRIKQYRGRAAWLKARHKGIGASDAPVILGLSPWQSAYSLYHEKINPVIDLADGNQAMNWGRYLEKEIAAEYTRRTGRKIANPGTYAIHQHGIHPWMLASLDREIVAIDSDGPGVLEAKNVSHHKRSDWEEEPPLMYQVQVQHQLAVTGYGWGVLCALVGGNDWRCFRIDRNDNFIEAMILKLRRFWIHVEKRVPPPVDASESTRETLERLYPYATDEVKELPGEFDEVKRKLEQIARLEKQLAQRKEGLKNQVREAIGAASYGFLPDGTGWSYKDQEREPTLTVGLSFIPDLESAGIPFETKQGKTFRVLRSTKRRDT